MTHGAEIASKQSLRERTTSPMNSFQQRLSICGVAEKPDYREQGISHMVSIGNPGAPHLKPDWFEGEHLQLWFGDVVSAADAIQCRTLAPKIEDIQQAMEFFQKGRKMPGSQFLVSCDYGASRSPALAYVFMADVLGLGREADALELVIKIRPEAVPNGLVVRLGDEILNRNGALLRPLKKLHAKINQEHFG